MSQSHSGTIGAQLGASGGMASRREREEDFARSERFRREHDEEQSSQRGCGGFGSANDAGQGVNAGDWERIISVAAGAGLATAGLLRGRWDGLLLTALGAGLVWRGYSGRCQCYAALGINTAEHHPATTAGDVREALFSQRVADTNKNEFDIVDEAGEESFPASDAPSWTAGQLRLGR